MISSANDPNKEEDYDYCLKGIYFAICRSGRHNSLFSKHEGEGEVAFFSAKRWDRRNRADLIESATPCHDAQVVGSTGTRTHSA